MSRSFLFCNLCVLLVACSPKQAENPEPDNFAARGLEIPQSFEQPESYAPASIRTQAAQTSPIQLMTGVWVSEEDVKETILFTSTSYTSFYENEKIVEEPIEYEPECRPYCKQAVAGAAACFLVRGESGFSCYTVLYVDQNRLEMRPTGATDVVLKYKRVS